MARGTAGAKKKKPKRQARPGGAPLKVASPGKSRRAAAPRSKKKAASSPRTRTAAPKKAKPPCKYGPRDAEGRCPKKPSSPRRQTASNRTKVTARTTGSATSQAIDVVTNPRASTEQKREAVGKVAEAAATQSLKAGAKKVAASGRLQKAKASAVDIARRVPVGGVLAPFVSAANIVLTKMPSEAQLKAATRARARADAAVAQVERSLAERGQKLPRKQRNILLKQHIDFFLKHPGA